MTDEPVESGSSPAGSGTAEGDVPRRQFAHLTPAERIDRLEESPRKRHPGLAERLGVNPTELGLTDAEWLTLATQQPQPRTEADRILMEYGYDPWEIELFLRLTPLERLRRADFWMNVSLKRRRELGIE